MEISVESIKELRNLTSASMAECKKALVETHGDIPKAVVSLRKRGLEIAAKKGERNAREGRIESYVHHGNKVGVILEVNCETDFVAKNPDFAQFTKDLVLHITACSPDYIKKEDVPADVLAQQEDKERFYKEHCLLNQVFVKDPSITVNDYMGSIVSKMGEKIVINRFARYKIG
ncbi:MAG: translation elongation factor Ts [Candidatus Omnitrophica bacterium]|jgi:elongation factor Ts|nr:translation elongation factor Ts [Candidatus Omnitrophota bacterium]